jgi:hypothetical protein
MRFSRLHAGQVGLLLSLAVLTSCNPSEFYPTEEFITGDDAFCSLARDLHTCQQLSDKCQPAYHYSANEEEEPKYAMCVANPDVYPDNGNDDSILADSDSESSSASTSSSGNDVAKKKNDSTATTSTSSTSSTSSSAIDSVAAPTIAEAFQSGCKNLDARYLWIKKRVTNNSTKVITRVKVCHHTGNGSAHTIVVACPSLKAHIDVRGDYLGACEL